MFIHILRIYRLKGDDLSQSNDNYDALVKRTVSKRHFCD